MVGCDSGIGEYETEEDEFEDHYTVGIQSDQFADSEDRAKYKDLKKKSPQVKLSHCFLSPLLVLENHFMLPYAPGARVVIRDEEWLVRRVDPSSASWELEKETA